jgi:hypothetical protein
MNKTSVDKRHGGIEGGGRLEGDGKINGFSPRRSKSFLNKVLNSECEVTCSVQTQPCIGMYLNTFSFGRN